MPVQWSPVCESSVRVDNVTHQHGRVVQFVSDETPPRTAHRPIAGAKKWISVEQDAALLIDVELPAEQLPYSDAILAGSHELPEGERTTIKGVRLIRQINDVDPLWATLVAAGTILANPADVVLPAEVQAAIDQQQAEADRRSAINWNRFAKEAAGLSAYLKLLMFSAPNPFTVLVSQIGSLHDQDRMLIAFNLCRASLPAEQALTTEEVAAVNALLQACGFTVRIA
jgi:hypothetical protein